MVRIAHGSFLTLVELVLRGAMKNSDDLIGSEYAEKMRALLVG